MLRSRRRLWALLIGVPALLVVSAVAYGIGMSRLEGETRTFWASLEWAVETFTTTGYGADSTWRHPAMVLFVIVLQSAGTLFIVLFVPLYLVPYLEERFEVRLPAAAPARLADHVVICRFGPAVASLLDELRAGGMPALVVEPDAAVARRLAEHGYAVIHRQLDDEALLAAGLPRARALVANGTDDENAVLALAARQLGFTGELLAIVENPYHRAPMMLTGASAAYTPRHILGAALAAHASEKLSPGGGAVAGPGSHFVVAGFGEVGQKVVELLRDAGEDVRVVDRLARPGVDYAGDVLETRLLEAAGVRAARAVVLALDSDSATLFATFICKDLAPTVPVIARVNDAPNVERIRRAGADFALSISQVSGQMLASRLQRKKPV